MDSIFQPQELLALDERAKRLLFLRDKDLRKRRIVHELQSVIYTEPGAYGGYLLICRDGSMLFGPKTMGKSFHRMAFESGLRTSEESLIERKCSLEEEIFSLSEELRLP